MNYELMYQVLNVLMYVLMFSIPITSLIVILEFWEAYKRRKNQHKKEAERIIVKMAEDVKEQTEVIRTLEEQAEKLKLSIFDLESRKREVQTDVMSEEEIKSSVEEQNDPEPEQIDYESFTVNELQDIARQLKIKGFSRMKKAKLIEKLATYSVDELMQISNNDNEQ